VFVFIKLLAKGGLDGFGKYSHEAVVEWEKE
jgi:hypothetical protein